MIHYDSIDKLPAHVLRDLAPFIEGMSANVDAVRRFFRPSLCAQSDIFLAESCGGRSGAERGCVGAGLPADTTYRFAWFHSLVPLHPQMMGYSDYYHGRYERCVAHAVEVTYRDCALQRTYAAVHVGLWGERKPERIDYSNTLNFRLSPGRLCDLIESVKQVRGRVELEKEVERFIAEWPEKSTPCS